MKLIYIIGLALGLGLGAASQASAANANDCKKSGNSYVCDPGDGNQYEYTTATSSAQAAAMLNAYLNNQQAQGQVQGQGQIANGGAGGQGGQGGNAEATAEGGNALSVATNGGNRVTISNPKQPKFTSSANLNGTINVDVAAIMRAKNSNIVDLGLAVEAVGNNCTALAVLNRSPSLFSWMDGTRLDISCSK